MRKSVLASNGDDETISLIIGIRTNEITMHDRCEDIFCASSDLGDGVQLVVGHDQSCQGVIMCHTRNTSRNFRLLETCQAKEQYQEQQQLMSSIFWHKC